MRPSLVFALLLTCFFLPWFAASISFYYYNNNSALTKIIKPPCGVLFPAGAILNHPLKIENSKWALLFIKPDADCCVDRFSLWQEQSSLYPSFLKKQNLEIVFLEKERLDDLDMALLQKNISWSLSSNGGCFLINPVGFISLAFSYDDSPKQAFFTIKKVVST